jgi:amino acid transporter
MLPRALARVHPTRHTPWVAIVVQGVTAWTLAVTNQFESLVIIANISALLIYLGCAIAAARIQQQDSRQQKVDGEPRNVGGFRVPGGYVVPVLTVMALLFLLSSATLKEWTVLVAVLAISSVVYAIAGQRSRSALVSGIGEGSTTP